MHQSDGTKIGIICLLKPSMCSVGNEILVSFDVSSLFTNVPVDKAVSIIRKRLREDGTLGDRNSLYRKPTHTDTWYCSTCIN